jgi:hypothetical protein
MKTVRQVPDLQINRFARGFQWEFCLGPGNLALVIRHFTSDRAKLTLCPGVISGKV